MFKIFVVFLIVFVTFIIPISLQLYFGSSRDEPQQNQTQVPSVKFEIVSIPPEQVIAGSLFQYKVVYTYSGADSVSVLVEEKPEWLIWDPQSLVFSGDVPSSISTFGIKFIISAGDSKKIQEIAIKVVEGQLLVTPSATPTPTVVTQVTTIPEPDEESPFLVSSTNDSWEDPYHPSRSVEIESQPLPESVYQEPSTVAAEVTSNANSSVLGASSSSISPFALPVGITIGVLVIIAIMIMFRSPKFTNASFESTIKTRSGLVIKSYSNHD
jgi:hypothetical protein